MGEGKTKNENAASKKINEADRPSSPHRHTPSTPPPLPRKEKKLGIPLPPSLRAVPSRSPPLPTPPYPQSPCVPITEQIEFGMRTTHNYRIYLVSSHSPAGRLNTPAPTIDLTRLNISLGIDAVPVPDPVFDGVDDDDAVEDGATLSSSDAASEDADDEKTDVVVDDDDDDIGNRTTGDAPNGRREEYEEYEEVEGTCTPIMRMDDDGNREGGTRICIGDCW
jgi:hypothetical protein